MGNTNIENSYKDGKRIATGDPEATWEVRCVSWGWTARSRSTSAFSDRRNFPKFDQAEAYAIEKSKNESEVE